MSKQSHEVTVEFLQAFAKAWNNHDVDDLMSFMTDDCVFESSAGNGACGTRYEGAQAVRAGYAKAWIDFPDARWADAPGRKAHEDDLDAALSQWCAELDCWEVTERLQAAGVPA